MKRMIYLLPFLGMMALPCIGFSQQTENPLDAPINLTGSVATLSDWLTRIEAETPVRFYYREEWMPRNFIAAAASGEPLRDVLGRLVLETDLGYLPYGAQSIVIAPKDQLDQLDAFEFSSYLEELADLEEKVAAEEEADRIFIGDSTIRPAPRQATLSGYVYDVDTDDNVAGGQIRVPKLQSGAFIDSLGRFSLKLPTGLHVVEIEALGHQKITQEIYLFSDGEWAVAAVSSAYSLDEILLEAESVGQDLASVTAGRVQLSMRDLRQSPTLFGEVDVVNTLLTLPGVSTVGEAATGFNVRGGNIDQNLMTQDGNMIFNSSHFLGLFSVFNADVIRNVALFKGHIPARYGGRISSVLEVDIKDGSFHQHKGRGSIGIFSSRMSFEGPIVPDKSSYVFAIRGAYPNLLTQYVDRVVEVRESSSYYGDVTMKATQRIGDQGTISVFGYGSQDFFRFSNDFGYAWRTISGGLKWQQIIKSQYTLTVEANSGRYVSEFFNADGPNGVKHNTGMDHQRMKTDLQWVPNRSHNVHAGLEATYYNVLPNEVEPFGEMSVAVPTNIAKDQGLELAVYAEDELRINSFLSLSAGLRFSLYNNLGPFNVQEYEPGLDRNPLNATGQTEYEFGESIQTYQGLEPRLSLVYLLNETASIKGSYNRLYQYVHLLSNSASSTPIDLWQVANPYFPAQRGDNYSLGFFKNFNSNEWQSSIEFFYREQTGVVVTKDFARLLANPTVETEVLDAIGQSYGVELSVKRTRGKFQFESSFAYARAFRRTQDNPENISVNNGAWFPADFDSPVSFNLSARWRPQPAKTLAINFLYRTGRPISVPVGFVPVYPSWNIPLFSERNTFRIPDYHRLDISYTFDESFISRRKSKSEFSVSVYNLYGRQNPFSVFFQKVDNEFRAFQLSILGTVLPMVSYNFTF
ncbi:MAG: TonB-dependent receptor [Bacteroidota bacterium]